MPDPLDTLRLHHCVDRWRAGDRAAADEMLRAAGERLEALARRMLRGFPAVRGCADTGDVLQNSLLRLLAALNDVRPESTRHFFNLAATVIRRELLDLARRFSGPRFARADLTDRAGADPAAPLEGDLEKWSRFHEAVEHLPAEEREVVGLTFYHGWTQTEVAALFRVDERTVRRRWQAACVALYRDLGGRVPGP